MELVVTEIKCVSTCRRFLNQPFRVRLLQLELKSNEAIPKNSYNYYDNKSGFRKNIYHKNNKARNLSLL